ncbi:hypothetical protein WMY93_022341 [Mugilogobius chulae]|uniref:Ig-like domain-containing protein n=1 Tax=Mugilogobius chulae TaxID=88201 RepID=A0AAW0NB11_9GOBI
MKMAAALTLWFITLGFCLIFTSAESSSSCTNFAIIGQPYEWPLTGNQKDRLWLRHNGQKIYDSRTNKKSDKVTADRKLVISKVSQVDKGEYTVEIIDSNGKIIETKSMHLCFQEPVQKPNVAVTCDNKPSQVKFTCSVPQPKDITYEWFDGGKLIFNEKTGILLRTFNQAGQNLFSCKVSNKVSSQTSNPVQQNCKPTSPASPESSKPKTEEEESSSNLLFGMEFWTMVAILAGGGGLVLVLIIATIVCCTLNRRKRKLRVKVVHEHSAEPSLRQPARPHPPQRRLPRPNTAAAPQGPTAAGPWGTGPRPPKGRLNRPRPPDPITGQPLPGPRLQHPADNQTSQPMIGNDDEENPPPLPQPRKTAPRRQKR